MVPGWAATAWLSLSEAPCRCTTSAQQGCVTMDSLAHSQCWWTSCGPTFLCHMATTGVAGHLPQRVPLRQGRQERSQLGGGCTRQHLLHHAAGDRVGDCLHLLACRWGRVWMRLDGHECERGGACCCVAAWICVSCFGCAGRDGLFGCSDPRYKGASAVVAVSACVRRLGWGDACQS